MHVDKININKKCEATLYVRSDVTIAKGFHTYVLKLMERGTSMACVNT